MKNKGKGRYEIRDSETRAGARAVYTNIGSILSWFNAYSPNYIGWSTDCDGRNIAKEYSTTKPKPVAKQYYTVRSGDTMSGIASKHKMTLATLGRLKPTDKELKQNICWSESKSQIRRCYEAKDTKTSKRCIVHNNHGRYTLVAYLATKGFIGDIEVAFWSAEVTIVSAIAGLNLTPEEEL